MADATATVSDRDLSDLYAFRAIASSPAEVSKKIKDLETDNQNQRSEINGLKEKVKGLPAEGAVVLAGDDATAYAAWKALEMKPDEVAKLKTDNATLSAEKAKRDRQDVLAAAREAEGWNEQAPKALLKLAGFDALELTPGEVTVERMVSGKKESAKAPTAFVTVDGKPVRISEWLKETHPEFVPLVTAQGASGASENGRSAPEQRGSAGSGGMKTEADFLAATTKTADYTGF